MSAELETVLALLFAAANRYQDGTPLVVEHSRRGLEHRTMELSIHKIVFHTVERSE
jgi:hypothetical protein